MDDYESLSHSEWECKIPRGVYPRRGGGKCCTESCGSIWERSSGSWPSKRKAGSRKVHLLPDHVHMMISIPPKYAVAQVIGFIKGKSAIHLARVYGGRKQNFVGQSFWARGYFVSTVGRDEAVVRDYIRTQEQEDKRLDQLDMWR